MVLKTILNYDSLNQLIKDMEVWGWSNEVLTYMRELITTTLDKFDKIRNDRVEYCQKENEKYYKERKEELYGLKM